MKIYNIKDIFNYSDKSIVYEIKRTKEVDELLTRYIDNQINLQFLILNGLYKRIVKCAKNAFELNEFTESRSFNFVEYCGYKLKIIN